MRKTIFIVLILFLTSCSPDQTTFSLNPGEQKLLEQFQGLDAKHKLKIPTVDEPGEKLKLCITLISKKTRGKLSDQRIHFFHASNEGEYEPKVEGDEITARLSGTATTDSEGRVFVETILPGDYGSSENNRRIHTMIFEAKPEGYDIHFKQHTSFMGNIFIEGSDQHFLADLKRHANGDLVVFLTMEPKFGTN